MKNLTTLLVSLTAAAGFMACGDDNKPAVDAPKAPDAFVPQDAPAPPAPPALGAQIDRMGRPAINTALTGPLADDPLKTAKKDAYNHAADAATWGATVVDPATTPPRSVIGEFARNMAIFDALDQGLFPGTPASTPPGTTGPGNGCGNQVLHSATTGYGTLATVLADDQLYVDTAKLTCNFYLSLEVEVAAQIPHSQCGGRTLFHDVVDTSYSLLSAGVFGFNPATFAPLIGDGVAVHADITPDTFPYLGVPH